MGSAPANDSDRWEERDSSKFFRRVLTDSMPFTLMGKSALVTGAGRGIGRAIASKLAGAGASVLVNDLEEQSACETESLITTLGGTAKHLAGDVTDPKFPQQLIDAVLQHFGGIDIVVNNAGYSWDTVIQKTTDEQFQAMLDIHLVAPFRILRAASHYIREEAKKEIAEHRRVMRKVVNITSIAGTDGNPGQAGYSSGKAGVVGLTTNSAKTPPFDWSNSVPRRLPRTGLTCFPLLRSIPATHM